MPESFSVRSEQADRVRRVTPSGELDIATAPVLENEVCAGCGSDLAPNLVIVDLTELTFMDSTGLQLLLRLNERFPDRLRIINDSSSVARLLDLSGARDRLPIIAKTTDPHAPLP